MNPVDRVPASSLAAFVFADLEGVITTVNGAFLRMWGYTEAAEVVGRPGSQFWLDPSDAVRRLAEVQASGHAQGEIIARRRDGSSFVAEFVANLVHDHRGVALGLLGEFIDVTDRVAAHQATAAQRRALKAIIDASPDWIFAKDLEHRLTLTNAAFAGAMNLTPAHMEGHLDTEFWPADQCESFHADDRRAFAGELVHNPDDIASLADGSQHIFDTIKGPLRDERGRVAGVFSISRDVTERRRTSEALHRLTRDLEAMLGVFPDLVMRLDADGQILDARSGDLDPTLLRPEMLVGRRSEDVFPPALVTILRDGIVEALTTGKVVLAEYEMPEGPVSEGRFVAVSPTQVLVVVRDITEGRRAQRALQATEERLRRAQKLDAVGRLAGGVAHDFNNLLTVIIGLGSALRSALSTDPKRAALAADIVGAGERAAALTRQLLAFGRAQPVTSQVVDLAALIRAFSSVLARMIGSGVTLSTSLTEDLHPVEIDPAHFEQVLLNLAVNARDAMPDGGALIIEAQNVVVDDPAVQVSGPCVRVSVRDRGVGMTDEVRARLFEPFFTTKAAGKGTGLGLATVYGILRQAGGDIAVETSPGAGTTFHIHLPRATAPLLRAAVSAASACGDETVLVVEDDSMVRSVTCAILREAGYRVLEAAAGAEGVAIALSECQFDVVVSDVVMPGMRGPEMVREILALRPGVPILFVTGHASDHDALEHLGRVLYKPFAPPALQAAVRSLLDDHAGGLESTKAPVVQT